MHDPHASTAVDTLAPLRAGDDAREAAAATPRTLRQLATLEELAELSMDMARMVRGVTATAIAHSPSGSGPEVAEFGRVFKGLAQCVRRTVALEARLAEGPPLRRASAPTVLDLDGRTPLTPRFRPDLSPEALRRAELRAVLEPAIEADPPERERLLDALDDELAVLGRRGDFLSRPFGELVLQICRDLPLYPDWTRWTNEDWVIDTAEALMAEAPPEPAGEPPLSRATAAVIPFTPSRGPP